jgi:hypothetical protein
VYTFIASNQLKSGVLRVCTDKNVSNNKPLKNMNWQKPSGGGACPDPAAGAALNRGGSARQGEGSAAWQQFNVKSGVFAGAICASSYQIKSKHAGFSSDRCSTVSVCHPSPSPAHREGGAAADAQAPQVLRAGTPSSQPPAQDAKSLSLQFKTR